MKKSAKDRLFYGFVFLVFVVLSFVIFRPADSDNFRGTVALEYSNEIDSAKYLETLESLLVVIDENVKCELGVWPTIKCDFRIESDAFVDSQLVNSNLLEKLNNIAFDETYANYMSLNESLSCFDLNNQIMHTTPEDMFYGKVNATCILNYQRAENSVN